MIGIVPEQGYRRHTKGFSKKSICWIHHVSDSLQINALHGCNYQEIRIRKKMDQLYMSMDTSQEKIIHVQK